MTQWIDFSILLYFLLLNGAYGLFLFFSMAEIKRTRATRLPELDSATLAQESAPPVSIIVPAFNESAGIATSVRAMLNLDYPHFQVIVVNDGSTDTTLDLLKERFGLQPVNMVFRQEIATENVRGIYRSRTEERIWVVDKENGGKADALNAGINISRTPLICCVDADSLVERSALLRLVEPFVYDPEEVVAVGGTVRLANGTTVRDGIIKSVGLPASWLARFQIVEYLRAFLFARLGFNRLGGNLIISGALGLFSRQVVVDVGGYKHDTVGEDMELVVRLHRNLRERAIPYKITFIPDPICYTEAPERWRVLGRQRDRWQRGLTDSLLRHRAMILNPRYGKVGLLSSPIYFFFELLGPLIELFGYCWFFFSFIVGRVDSTIAILFFSIAFLLGFFLSLQALILDDLSFHVYRGKRIQFKLMITAALENFGYRQLILFYRMRGMIRFVFGAKTWGNMRRQGFQEETIEEVQRKKSAL